MKSSRKKSAKDKRSLYARGTIIALIAVSFAILFFLLLIPKQEDIVKGVTYSLKYPRISHYSQVPGKVFEDDFRLMKAAGINTIRLYGIPPEFILDLADKYGIKVIETIVFPGDWTDFTSPYQLQALKREAIRNVNRDIGRECIYAWSIWNDAPWTYGSGKGDVIKAYGEERVSAFLKEIYEAVKKQDPLRPVTAATLMLDEKSRRLGTDFLDILGYNVYLGVADWRDGMYDPKLAEKMVDELVDISRKYGKPVLITETGYSTYWVGALQEDVIRDQIRKVDRRLKGIILFQWADDWSKAGEISVHNDNVEEHWGLVEGERKLKGGYKAVRSSFKINPFGRFLLSASDYFRGSYFASRKRALKKKWKEEVVADSEIEKLQNKLNLRQSDEAVPGILEELSRRFFEKRGFDQFAAFLKDLRPSYAQPPYEGLVDYYIALTGWNKLEYLASSRQWELYYAEKERGLGKIISLLEKAETETKGGRPFIKVLYLEWLIQNDLLKGNESAALERFNKEVKDYARSTGDLAILLAYSGMLEEEGEPRLARAMLLEYASRVEETQKPRQAAALLRKKADEEYGNKNFARAKILYGAYINIAIRSYSEVDASFAVLELANLYERRALHDEAIELYDRLLKGFPASELADDAAFARAMAMKNKKSYSKAIEAFHDFIVGYPDSELSKSAVKEALSIFTVYGKGTQAQKTAAFLTEIIALYPESDFSIMARFELASALATLGRREEAIREYHYIIDNHPDSDFAVYSQKSIERLQ